MAVEDSLEGAIEAEEVDEGGDEGGGVLVATRHYNQIPVHQAIAVTATDLKMMSQAVLT